MPDQSTRAREREPAGVSERSRGPFFQRLIDYGFSDVMANGVVRAAESLGLRVPEDLSVVGFDDSPLASRMRPTLTTVRQPVAEKGHTAAAALTALIEREKSETGKSRARHFLLPTELIVRESTAPPRDGSKKS